MRNSSSAQDQMLRDSSSSNPSENHDGNIKREISLSHSQIFFRNRFLLASVEDKDGSYNANNDQSFKLPSF